MYGTRNIKKHFRICLFLLKYFNNFEHQHICMILVRVVCWNIPTFSEKFTKLKIFLVPLQCLFFYLASKKLVFLNKTNSSCSKWLKYCIKMVTLKLSAALLYWSGGVRNFYIKHQYIYRLRIYLVKMVEVFRPESPDYKI